MRRVKAHQQYSSRPCIQATGVKTDVSSSGGGHGISAAKLNFSARAGINYIARNRAKAMPGGEAGTGYCIFVYYFYHNMGPRALEHIRG